MKKDPKPTRAGVLHAVTEEILARKDGQIPTNVDGIDTFFHDPEDLADALLLRWHTLLTASLERGLAGDPEDRKEMVIDAWRHAAETYRGVRMVIDELAENPPTEGVAQAVRTTARNDWAAMAIAAGLASDFDEPAIRVGHRLELEARRRNNLVEHTAVREPRPPTLLGKFKTILIG
jgi:hypothetical protein